MVNVPPFPPCSWDLEQRPTFGNHLNRKCERTWATTWPVFGFIFVALSGNCHLHWFYLAVKTNEHIDCSLIILFMTLIYKITKYCQVLVISEKWLIFFLHLWATPFFLKMFSCFILQQYLCFLSLCYSDEVIYQYILSLEDLLFLNLTMTARFSWCFVLLHQWQ